MALLTPSWILDWLLFLGFIYIILYFYVTRNFSFLSKLRIKVYEKPIAFFGNFAPVFFARKTPDHFLRDIYNAGKGQQFIGYYVMDTPHVMVRDPELVKHVLVKDAANFYNRYASGNENDDMSNCNLLLVKHPPWKSIRQKLNPLFTTGKLKLMFELMLEICKDLRTHLASLNLQGNGQILEMKELCASFTTDIIGLAAYGMNLNSLSNPDAEFRKHGRHFLRSTYKRYLDFVSMFFIPQLLKPLRAKFFDHDTSIFLRDAFWEAINQRIEGGIKRADLLDLLIELRKKKQMDPSSVDFKIDGDALISQAAIFFSGGFETSSTTMSFAFYELAKHPESQEKLRREINDAIEANDGKITYEMMGSLPYLQMVIDEVLRMYPILPFLDRVPENDYQFTGTNLTIPKGTPVILPMRAMHMDPDYFPNPEVYDPERFNSENKKNIIPYTYYPMGEGPRSCIGQRVGFIQVKLGIIEIISKYEVEPCEKTTIPMEFDPLYPFIRSREGIHLRVKKLS